jgi:hypothetical protein
MHTTPPLNNSIVAQHSNKTASFFASLAAHHCVNTNSFLFLRTILFNMAASFLHCTMRVIQPPYFFWARLVHPSRLHFMILCHYCDCKGRKVLMVFTNSNVDIWIFQLSDSHHKTLHYLYPVTTTILTSLFLFCHGVVAIIPPMTFSSWEYHFLNSSSVLNVNTNENTAQKYICWSEGTTVV